MTYTPRKSEFGTNTTFVCELEHPLSPQNVQLFSCFPTFLPSPEKREELAASFREKFPNRNPGRNDLQWRYERFELDGDTLKITLSPTLYSWHNLLRNTPSSPDLSFAEQHRMYPTPFTINSLQLTSDGYLPIAVRGGISDQRGLCALGSGFVDRLEGDAFPQSSHQLRIPLLYTTFDVVNKECSEETQYNVSADCISPSAFNINNSRFLGLVRGSNTDIAAIHFVPLNLPVTHRSVHLRPGNNEHSDLLFLPSDEKSIKEFLQQGGRDGMIANDHLLGGLELFLKHRHENGNL